MNKVSIKIIMDGPKGIRFPVEILQDSIESQKTWDGMLVNKEVDSDGHAELTYEWELP